MILLSLALLLSSAARADQLAFPIKVAATGASWLSSGYSADGYHFAEFMKVEGKPVILKDGKVLEEGVEPALGDEGVALSADGGIVAYVVKARASNGLPSGEQVHVNGKAIGSRYEQIRDFKLSPNGSQMAFAAKDAKGWRVVSTFGESPVVPEQPKFVAVSNTGTVCILIWEGHSYLYRDQKPTPVSTYDGASDAVAASPDLSRVAGVARRDDGYVVEENGRVLPGVWGFAEGIEYFNGGKDLAYFVRTQPSYGRDFDAVVTDGVVRKIPPTGVGGDTRQLAVSPRKSEPVVVSGAAHVLTIAGKKFAAFKSFLWRSHGWIGFSPSGAHWLIYADGKLRSEAGVIEESALDPANAPVFEGESEYHYLTESNGRALVCGSLGDRSASQTRCARKARSMGLRPAAD